MGIRFIDIVKSDCFMETLHKAYKINKPKIESGFLVQARPKVHIQGINNLNDLEIKINEPKRGTYTIIDLSAWEGGFKASHYGMPEGGKGEGFYLERYYHSLVHFHFHPVNTNCRCSREDFNTYYEMRNKNIRKAKRIKSSHFINPVFIIGNKKRGVIEIRILIFTYVKSKRDYEMLEQVLFLNDISELKERQKALRKISQYMVCPIPS